MIAMSAQKTANRLTTTANRTTRPRPTTSPARAEAARRNGRKSKGPNTPEGKEKSRKNAIKHGLFASILPSREVPFLVDKKVYEELITQYTEDFQPSSQFEVTLIESLAFEMMRLRFIHAMENTAWDRHRPPEQRVKSLHLNLDYHTQGMTLDEMKARMECFQAFLWGLSEGRLPALSKEQVVMISETLRKGFNNIDTRIDQYRKDLAELEEHASDMAPEELEQKRAMTMEPLAAYENARQEAGREALGCTEPGAIEAFVSGKEPIPADKRDAWIKTLQCATEDTQFNLRAMRGHQGQLDELRSQCLETLMQDAPRLERFNRYETMVRRNIDRTLHQLREFRELRTMCVG